jgi:hypothetical protein
VAEAGGEIPDNMAKNAAAMARTERCTNCMATPFGG